MGLAPELRHNHVGLITNTQLKLYLVIHPSIVDYEGNVHALPVHSNGPKGHIPADCAVVATTRSLSLL